MKNRAIIFIIFVALLFGCEMSFKKNVIINDFNIPINGNSVITTYTEIYTDFDAVCGDIILKNVSLTVEMENPGSVDDTLDLWISKEGKASKNIPYNYISEPAYTSDPEKSVHLTETPITIKAGETKNIKISINDPQQLKVISNIMTNGEVYVLFKNQLSSTFPVNFELRVHSPTISVEGMIAFSLINPIF